MTERQSEIGVAYVRTISSRHTHINMISNMMLGTIQKRTTRDDSREIL